MSGLTTRLSLVTPVDPEPIDVAILDANFTQLDYAAGVLLVNAGVTPPNSALYDGAVVKEKGTDIMWVAQKNGGGGFDKVFLQAGATTPWVGIGSLNANLQGVIGAYPTFRIRRANGKIEFRGAMFYNGAITAGGTILVGSHSYITAAADPNVIDSIGFAIAQYGNTTVQPLARVGIRANGQLFIQCPTAQTNAVFNLDGVSFYDSSAGM